MTKAKVIDLKKLYNFVVDKFFILNHVSNENYVWISHIWNSKFSNNFGWRNDQNNVVDLDYIHNFTVLKLFYLPGQLQIQWISFRKDQQVFIKNVHILDSHSVLNPLTPARLGTDAVYFSIVIWIRHFIKLFYIFLWP